MMTFHVQEHFSARLEALRVSRTYKSERPLDGPQGAAVRAAGAAGPLVNLCANNYLGLANDPRIVEAAREALATWGYGMASVRFICGTQTPHLQLEQKLAAFLHAEAAVLFSSCFDANAGVFECLLDAQDVVLSDELNHASIIDGIRLCKARRLRYRHADMDDLAAKLAECGESRIRLIVTDGVFSMDGTVARLPEIAALARASGALLMVDDSHAVGVFGATGAGTPEHFGLQGEVDLLSGTFGKALGGASGGYIAGSETLVDCLRQGARPYLFSNSLPPAVVQASSTAIDIARSDNARRVRLWDNTRAFRNAMHAAGFDVGQSESPIVPIMVGDAATASAWAAQVQSHGVYCVAFSHPVVPLGKARLRTQMSSEHTPQQLSWAVEQFVLCRDLLR
jgi:glycine C-acetyltransferase